MENISLPVLPADILRCEIVRVHLIYLCATMIQQIRLKCSMVKVEG